MPEGLEAEIYRAVAARGAGRTISTVSVDERQAAAGGLLRGLPGRCVEGARRLGKWVLVDLDDGHVLGMHFGMTGRLIVDGEAPIERLVYGSGRDDPAWDRLVVRFAGGDVMRVNDPRRWATFTLDPSLDRLGPDFLSVDTAALVSILGRRRAPVKAVLLDQSAVAGYGNLCVDEVLWQAGVAPDRTASSLTRAEVRAIARAGARHLPAMLARGGSHRGTVSPEVRATLPACPRDGTPMRRGTVGGRTTVWCPVHQR